MRSDDICNTQDRNPELQKPTTLAGDYNILVAIQKLARLWIIRVTP